MNTRSSNLLALALLAIVPGCVDDVLVGLRELPIGEDAGAPDDASSEWPDGMVDAGEPDASADAEAPDASADAEVEAGPPPPLGPCFSCDIVVSIGFEQQCADGTPKACWEKPDGTCDKLCPDVPSCRAGSPEDCAADEYCFFPRNDCGMSSDGFCAPRPRECAPGPAVVCGCDGLIYPSICVAARAGTAFLSNEFGTCK